MPLPLPNLTLNTKASSSADSTGNSWGWETPFNQGDWVVSVNNKGTSLGNSLAGGKLSPMVLGAGLLVAWLLLRKRKGA